MDWVEVTKWPINRMSHKTFPSIQRNFLRIKLFPVPPGNTDGKSEVVWTHEAFHSFTLWWRSSGGTTRVKNLGRSWALKVSLILHTSTKSLWFFPLSDTSTHWNFSPDLHLTPDFPSTFGGCSTSKSYILVCVISFF